MVGADGRTRGAQLLIKIAQAASAIGVQRVFRIEGDPGVGSEGEDGAIGGGDLTDDDIDAGGSIAFAGGLDGSRQGVRCGCGCGCLGVVDAAGGAVERVETKPETAGGHDQKTDDGDEDDRRHQAAEGRGEVEGARKEAAAGGGAGHQG